MDIMTHKIISATLFLLGIFWVLFNIFSSWGTVCFDMLNSYATIGILMTDMFWINFVKPDIH